MKLPSRKYLIVLIVVPAVLAIVVFILASQMPAKYVSTAEIDVMGDLGRADAVMNSSFVTESDNVKAAIEQDIKNGGSSSLAGRFKFDRSRVDIANVPPVLAFQVTSASAAGAQALSRALIDGWISALKPRGEEKVKLEGQLASASAELASVVKDLESLAALRDQMPPGETSVAKLELEYHFISFGQQLAARGRSLREQIGALTYQIAGPARDKVVVSGPDLPAAPEKSDAAIYASLSFIASMTFLLFAFFVKSEYLKR